MTLRKIQLSAVTLVLLILCLEALADIICGAGRESAAALFVLMGKLQDATDPQTFAHTAKHFAFTRCGELNVFGMVDAQIALLEGELLAGNTLVS